MLDGEAVAHCLEGLPNFHKLLADGQASACFYAFDLLWLEAQDVPGVELGPVLIRGIPGGLEG
jgi:ATP-dependent DNA ligase